MTAPELKKGSPNAERVLVVDDESDIVALVAYHLAKAGYRVSTASTGADALAQAKNEVPALVVLDLMLPGMSGFEVLEQLRADESTAHVAVLMLTARRDEPDRIRGLSLGADDYLTKPFSPQELVLRVGAILRRLSTPAVPTGDVINVGAIRIDRAAHQVTVGREPIELTPTEFKLLLTLAERKGRVQARSHLLEAVWDAAPDIQTRTVDMHVQRLRTKLGGAGDMIETVRGFGYRINPTPATAQSA
jgi:two-component system phosphate regulon response regulator PhoB